MDCRCWKCRAILKSKRDKFCPSCGIVTPYNGWKKVWRLSAKQHRVCSAIKVNEWLCPILLFASTFWPVFMFVVYMRGFRSSEMTLVTVICLAFLVLGAVLGFALKPLEHVDWCLRGEIRKQEQESVKIHPDFLNETSLLRASEAPKSPETLLRPAQDGTQSDPQQLLRAGRSDHEG